MSSDEKRNQTFEEFAETETENIQYYYIFVIHVYYFCFLQINQGRKYILGKTGTPPPLKYAQNISSPIHWYKYTYI